MQGRAWHGYLILLIGLGLLMMMPACTGGPSAQAGPPVASITSPENNSGVSAGQRVTIAFSAADLKGVSQVELVIDGQAVRVNTVNPPVNSFVASEPWTPQAPGSHVIEVRAFNVDGIASEPARIVIIVNAPVEAASPTPTPVDTPTSPAAEVPPTPTLDLPTPTATPTTETVVEKPMVTALVALNVRGGPGTDYPVIGRLAVNETAEITGRDEAGGWWQIVFTSAGSDRGWVAASNEFPSASNASGVPVAQAPPRPAAAPTTAPTNTPDTLKPTIFSFTADRYTITAGETVALSWDLANAQAAFLRYDGNEEGVVAPGNKIVSPTKDTVYTLLARNAAGETTAQLTIKVGGPQPTSAPVFRDGRTGLSSGQSIDFDRGTVFQGNSSSEADFYWDGQQKKFFPQGSAIGTLLKVDYNSITLQSCLAAPYGDLPQIDTSGLITGCYKTNEGRVGKFYVTQWDFAGNLTINWLTWDYR